MIGNIIGSLDTEVIRAYLAHMKATDATLYKTWGSKWAPPVEETEEDPFADMDLAGPEEDPFADTGTDEPAPPEPIQKFDIRDASRSKGTVNVSVGEDGKGIIMSPGVSTPIPEIFKLRTPDGLTTELEVFSRGKFGYLLERKVLREMRTLTLKGGKEITVDLLALQRDPDGMTEGVANSKLLVFAELQAE